MLVVHSLSRKEEEEEEKKKFEETGCCFHKVLASISYQIREFGEAKGGLSYPNQPNGGVLRSRDQIWIIMSMKDKKVKQFPISGTVRKPLTFIIERNIHVLNVIHVC